MTVTHTGKQRGKEKLGLGGKAMERQAQLAKERGLLHKNMGGRLHKWVASFSYNSPRAMSAAYIIYNNKLFVFTSDLETLVTVADVPTNLQKLAATQLAKSKK